MIIRKIFIETLLTLDFGFFVQSQEYKTIAMPEGAIVKSTVVREGITTHYYSNPVAPFVNGSPYLDDNFIKGSIHLVNGNSIMNVMLRYNMHADKFEIQSTDDTLVINKPHEIEMIVYKDKIFVFNPDVLKSIDQHPRFYERLLDGITTLYVKHKVEFRYEEFVPNYGGGSGSKEYYYIPKIEYYLITGPGNVFKLSSKKKFLKNIPTHKAEMKEYIMKNKISLKEENEIVNLIEYYNSLN